MLTKTLKLLVFLGIFFISYKSYAQPAFTIQNVKGDCEGSSTGSLEVLVTSANGPIEIYVIAPLIGPFTATVGVPVSITGLTGASGPGRTYIVAVSDDDGPSSSNIQILSYANALTGTIASVTHNSDCLVSNGAINITPSGGSGVYTFAWEKLSDPGFSASTEDLTGLLGGNYRVTIGDVNSNCTEVLPIITVNNPSPALFDLTSPTLPVCTGTDLTLSLDGSEPGVAYEVYRNNVIPTGITQTGTGGPLNFTVPFGSFSNGNNFKIFATSGICEGDMNGVIIAVIVPLPTASTSGGGSACNGSPLPNVTFTFTGTAPFTFTYTNGTTPVTVTNHPTTTFTLSPALSVGTYRVTALTDANGCAATNLGGSVNVVVNALPTATISGGGPVCSGSPLPSVTFNFTGTAPFNFTYTNGVTPVTVNNHATNIFTIPTAAAGTYSITALSDANGCIGTSFGTPVSVIVNTLPTASTAGGGTVCSGVTLPNVTFTFTGTAPFTFTYTNGTTPVTVTNHPTTTFTLSPAPSAGTYRVTALTGANGCAATNLGGSVNVVVNALPTATISGGGPVCSGAPLPSVTFNFTGTAPFNFTYTNGTTPVTVNNHPTNIFTIPTAAAGTYSITALSAANGCIGTNFGTPVSVIVNTLPTASTAGGGTVCSGVTLPNVTFTFTGTAPFTFTYTNGTTPVTVTNHPTTTFTLSPALSAGTYRVTALTGANGCAATNLGGSVNVVVNALPTAAISGGGPVCSGAPLPSVTFNFTGTAPFNFTYTNGTTPVTVNNHPTNIFTIPTAAAGTYSITALSAANGCIGTNFGTPVSVIVNTLPTASTAGGGTVCSGVTLPNVTFTFTGTAPFTFTYTNGTTPVTVTNHPTTTFTLSPAPSAGTYRVTALTGANGCAATNLGGSVNVVVNALPTAAISGGGPVCSGSPLPSVTFNFTGTAPFTFTYTNGTTPVTVNNHATNIFTIPTAAAGTYSITALSAANGCIGTSFGTPVSVIVNTLPTASTAGGGTVCSGVTLPNVTFTFTGTAPFTFTYTNGTTPVTVTNHPTTTFTLSPAPSAGTYRVTALTVANGCVATNLGGSVNVVANALPTATISGGGPVCSGSPLPSVTFNFTGTAPFNFTYTNGTTPVTVNNHPTNIFTIPAAAAGTYSITALSAANGCIGTSFGTPVSVVVNQSPTASIGISGTSAICAGGNADLLFTLPATGTYNVVYTNGTTNFNANGISNGATVNVTQTGTYTIVSVTNAATLCSATAPSPNITGSAVITITSGPVLVSPQAKTICDGQNVAYEILLSPANLPAGTVFNWNDPDGTGPATAGVNVPMGLAGTTHINDILTNTTASAITVTYLVTPAVGGCSGNALPIDITVLPVPAVASLLVESACAGSTSTNIHYGPMPGSPNQYSIDFDNPGFTDVVNAPITASPLSVPILATATPNSYAATLTVRNSVTGCSSLGTPITITIVGLPVPTITSGPADVCVNSTGNVYTTQTGKTGYVWTVSPGGTITAGAGTNSITVAWNGIGTKTVTVNYIENTCAAATPGTLTVNVNDTPTIAGVNVNPVCSGSNASITYSGLTGTPVQYSIDFNGAAETAGLTDIVASLPVSPIPVVIPATVAPGTYSADLTVINATGCVSAVTPISITVKPSPTATVTGTTSICTGSAANITFNFTGTSPWTFQYTDGTTTFPAVTWPSSTISFSPALTTTTTYTVVSISDASGCTGTPGASLTVTVNQNPQINLTVGVTPNPLCSGGIADVTVNNSEVGVSYQLRNMVGNTPVGAPVVGTGGPISLSTGALLSTQTFNVLATATGCTPVQLTNTATVNVSGAVDPSLAVTAVANRICEGSATVIQVVNSENGVLYQLRDDADNSPVGPAVAGTGNTIDLPTNNLAATTAFNVLATNGSCSIELTNIETVTVDVLPDASLVVAVTLDPICVGGSSVVTVTASEAGVSYQLRTEPGNLNVGPAIVSTGGLLSLPTGALATTTSFNVLATSGVCAPVKLTAIAIVNVSGTIDASLAVTAVPATICSGTATGIEVTNSESGVTYQLRNNATDAPVGTPVPGNGGTITLPTLNLLATTTFNVLANNGTCSIELAETETVTVDPAPNAGLIVGATLNPLCVGGSSAVTIQGSQLGVNYQLRNDAGDIDIGPPVVGTGSPIILPTGSLSATTAFNVLATSGVCAPVELTQGVTINVAGTLNAALNLASSASPICEGSSTFIRVLLSETGVNYQLRNDANDNNVGISVVGDGGTINLPTGNLLATTTFNVVASNGTCSIELVDTETVNINPTPDVTLAVAPSSGLICSGTATNIVVTGSELGVSYQLRNNAGNVNIGLPVAGANGNISLPTGNLTASTTFNVFATAGSCSAQLSATASVVIRPGGDPACGGGGPGGSDCANFSAIIPTIVTQPSCNDRDAGEVSFAITRSDASATTFRVIWSYNGTDQTKFTSNTVSFDDLSSGLYKYTIIDEGNGKSCGPVDFFLDLKTQVEIQDKEVIANVTCADGTDGNVKLTVDGTTTGEYWYKYVVDGQESVAQTFTPGAPLPGGLPADDDDFIIIKVDESFAFTCPDTVMVRIKHIYPRIDFAVASTQVTTCNGTDGGIQVTGITGGNTTTAPVQIRLKKEVPLSTDPSGYIVVADFEVVSGGAKNYTDLAQANYIIDVKDESDCIQSKPIAIQAPGQVPMAVVDIIATDASCSNEGASGTIQVTINAPGIYEVAVSEDQVNVPDDDQFVSYNSPSLPSITFNNLTRGRYFLYIKSSTTECPTRSDVISVGGVYAVSDFDVLSNCENVNLTLNNLTGQEDTPFTIRVFNNNDKFFKIDSLTASAIPQSKSVSFIYSAPLQHKFLTEEGTYRFVMIQKQTTGAGACTLVSDTVVYEIREPIGIVLGQVKPSFPDPKRTGSIEIENIIGGQRFVSGTNELYYEVSLTTAGDDIVVFDWSQLKLNPQNKFSTVFDYLPPGVYRVKVRDATGCIKTQDVDVSLDPSVYVPNIFTPNDDAVNDEFEVMNLPADGKHKLIVSNRWGNEVYSSNDYREGNFWNAAGTSDGIYFYRLQVQGGQTFTGWVEILRGNKP